MPSKQQEKEIKNLNSFVDEVMGLRKGESEDFEGQWFFRGQNNADWEARPNIFRTECEITPNSEHDAIGRALQLNPVGFKDCKDNFEILTKLQHYGLGTRLLDLTLNPLVALFFASEPSEKFLENKNGQFTRKMHDGKIFYRFVKGCSLNDIEIKIALNIPFIAFPENMTLEKLYKILKDNGAVTETEYEWLCDDEYREGIRLLQTNSFFAATNSNTRLIQQRGAFLVSPAINIKPSPEKKASVISKARKDLSEEFEGSFIISADDKNGIRKELDFFNVNEATLFPEFEHQMSYIQKQMTKSVGTVEEYTIFRDASTRRHVPYKKSADNVKDILEVVLPGLDVRKMTSISALINDEMTNPDWETKESILGKIRRTVKREIQDELSATEANSKANEIIDRLLE